MDKKIIISTISLVVFAVIVHLFYSTNRIQELKQGEMSIEKEIADTTRPSSSKIAYLEYVEVENEWQIWIVDTLTKEKEYSGSSFAFSDKAKNPSFSLSPNLKYACIVHGMQLDDEEVYFFDVESKIMKRVSDFSFPVTESHDGSDVGRCRWSIDNTKLSFAFSQNSHTVSEGGQDNIWIGDPPKELKDLLGHYYFDVNLQETKKQFGSDVSAYMRLHNQSTSRSFSQGKRIAIVHTLLKHDGDYKMRLIKHKGNLGIDNPIYKERECLPFKTSDVTEPSPIALSPDHQKFAYIDGSHKIAVISDGVSTTYDNAEVHGRFSRFYWISNEEIVFWQSQGGVAYNTDNGDWYRGDLMLLNIETSDVTNLTTSGDVLVQFY